MPPLLLLLLTLACSMEGNIPFHCISLVLAIFLESEHILPLPTDAFVVFLNWYSCREIYQRFRASSVGKVDVHTRLMRRYKDIPSWWFYLLLLGTTLVSLALCVFLKSQVQLPYWGLLLAAALAFIFTLPISIITATTNQVTEMLI